MYIYYLDREDTATRGMKPGVVGCKITTKDS